MVLPYLVLQWHNSEATLFRGDAASTQGPGSGIATYVHLYNNAGYWPHCNSSLILANQADVPLLSPHVWKL